MTRTRVPERPQTEQRHQRELQALAATRREELVWLLLASVVVAAGLMLTGLAMSGAVEEAQHRLAQKAVLDLNQLASANQLLPYLADIADPAERRYVAERIYRDVHTHPMRNTGEIARLRVHRSDLKDHRELKSFGVRIQALLDQAAASRRERLARMSWLGRKMTAFREWLMPPPERDPAVSLLTQREFHNLKPWLTVRTMAQFRLRLVAWTLLYFAVFYAAHLVLRWRSFAGDNLILPVLHLLSGAGLMLMVSLRDPLRDMLSFTDFTLGVALGLVAFCIAATIDYDRATKRYSFVFLLASALLGVMLAVFGRGPGLSDAKVNLFGAQPVEIIRLLIVFFLAGYFAEHWDLLRDLRQKQGVLGLWSARFHVPRLDYVLPVAVGTAVSLLLFFLLKDLGPALVIGCLFLILYAVARKQVLAAALGLGVIILGFAAGHAIGYPETVEQRVEIWRQPWSNTVRGGDQIAQSIWALSSGGWQGTGPGLGSPGYIPAGHTDLILSAAGEELGFVGLLLIFVLYALLIDRSLRAARNAPNSYLFFLATGLTLIIALQLLLIAGGLLDLIPLSGVVSPFLSFGKSSMIANFALFGIVLAISSRSNEGEQQRNFGGPLRVLRICLAGCLIVLAGRAAFFQVWAADRYAVEDAEVRYADGGIGLEYNPRIARIIRELPKGDIFDRNGIPLATSDMAIIEKHRSDYARLGVALDHSVSTAEPRHYPLGPEFFYLVGDVRSTLKRGARNTSFQERLSRVRLQGYDDRREIVTLDDPDSDVNTRVFRYDYSELLPLLRHRYSPNDAAVRDLRERARDVRMSIDARLQLQASAILKKHLAPVNRKGAVVVLDPATGDLLAAVSYPWPEDNEFAGFLSNPDRTMDRDLLDRARFGLYPPGSSFKIVTATAALRLNPALATETFECRKLDDGRVGAFIGKSKRPIRDDVQDRIPHGTVNMEKGITVSCNAYFAQLGALRVGPQALLDTAAMFGIDVARPNTAEKLKEALPQASYGQGQVVATPFQMARVAAAVAAGGNIPQGRWVLDETNTRTNEPVPALPPAIAAQLAGYMREAVSSPAGTGKVLASHQIPIAGKTGTAELSHAQSHAWFIGYAPYGQPGRKIAFAVLVENGQYGGRTAAPIAGEIVTAAREIGLF